MKTLAHLVLALFAASAAVPALAAAPPEIAITIDDLPVHGPLPEGEVGHRLELDRDLGRCR